MTDHIFISYARQDGLAHAEKLDSELSRAGLQTWRDKRNLDPSQDFTAELEKAIEVARQVTVCLTPDTLRENSFVRREIQYALALHKPIVPLLFDDLVPPIHIINHTYIDFHKQAWEKSFIELLKRLRQSPADYHIPKLPDDPFREYLNMLYGQIVNYLDKTVFSLIALNTDDTPDAVVPIREEPVNALPMAFFDMLPNDEIPTPPIQPYANFHEAFAHFGGRVLLLGEPGGGKTTTLMAYTRDAVAKRLEDPTQPLPLIAPIATWDVVKTPSLVDWLSQQIRVLKMDDLARVIESGKALLLLDGLDELGAEREDPETKERFDPRLRFIEMLSNVNPKNHLLMTCRIKDYGEIGQKLNLNGAVTLRPLDDEQMRIYLAKQPDLLAAIESDAALREMAQTPLVLSLFTFAYNGLADEAKQLRDLAHSPGDLRDKIFETYLRRRYEHESRKPNVNLSFTLADIYQILELKAINTLQGLFGDEVIFTFSNFEAVTEDKHRYSFIQLALLLHLIVKVDNDHFQFIHLLFRDYLAFRSAINRLQHSSQDQIYDVTSALSRLNDIRAISPLWNAFKIYKENSNGRISIAQALYEISTSASKRNLKISLNVSEVAQIDYELNNDITHYPSIVWYLIHFVANIDYETAIKLLKDNLYKHEIRRQALVLVQLRKMNFPDIETKILIFKQENLPMYSIGAQKIRILLIHFMSYRIDTIWKLLKIRDELEEVKPSLNIEFEVVGFSLDAQEGVDMAQLLNPDIVIADVNLLEFDGFQAAHKILNNNKNIKVIFISVQSDLSYIRQAKRVGATNYLFAPINPDELYRAIFQAVVTNEEASIFQNIDDGVDQISLIKSLENDDVEIRRYAITELAKFGENKFKDYFVSALKDKDSLIRAEAAYGLGQMNDYTIVPLLIETLKDSEGVARIGGIMGLEALADTISVKPLIDLLSDFTKTDDFGRVCDAAAEALENIGTPEALKAVTAWRGAQSLDDS